MCDQVPTTRGRRLFNGQIGYTFHHQKSYVVPTLGQPYQPNVGWTLACQLRRSTNHADHVPTLDQRLVADWEIGMWSITNFIIHSTWVYLFWMGFMLFNHFLIICFFNFVYLSFHNVFNLFVMLSPIISNNIYNAIVQGSLSKINPF